MKFNKVLKQRIHKAKQMMLSKQEMNADFFTSHEQGRRANCTYTIGRANRKKDPSQLAYERRIQNLLYKDRFDRKMEEPSEIVRRKSQTTKETK